MGDSMMNMVDPVNTLGRTETKDVYGYVKKLPEFLRTASVQQPFLTPKYQQALSGYYGGIPFDQVQQNIADWHTEKAPVVNEKVGTKKQLSGGMFGMGNMVFKPSVQSWMNSGDEVKYKDFVKPKPQFTSYY